ncbi:MAG: hypothetical protein KAR36_04645, partial [Candidatus Latescibacteria bacterium]|nr:hypothetical protein [Candidatus Latescibacterota bacterium]
ERNDFVVAAKSETSHSKRRRALDKSGWSPAPNRDVYVTADGFRFKRRCLGKSRNLVGNMRFHHHSGGAYG